MLWLLLGSERDALAGHLSTDELLQLRDAMQAYAAADENQKASALRMVQHVLTGREGSTTLWAFSAALLALTVLLAIVHAIQQPDRSFLYLLSLFGPLLIACSAPFFFYRIPLYRRIGLFAPTGFFYALPAFVALLWLLFSINTVTALPTTRLPALEMGILSLGALLAPLFEELFFREILPSAIGRFPHFAGHLGSAFLFAVLHLPVDGWQFLLYLMAAATLSLLRIVTDSLLWPVVVHSAANVTSLWVMT